MASLTSINLIGVHWSYRCASTCWLACSDMCLSYFQLDSIIHCTPMQLELSWVNHGLINGLTRCVDRGWHSVKLHPFIQFEWPPWEFKLSFHSCILHDHCIVLFIILFIQSCYFHCNTIFPILCIFVCILCETVFSVLRPLWQANMVFKFIEGRSSNLSKIRFLKDLAWKIEQ